MQTVDLAKLQEKKFLELRKYQRPSYSQATSHNISTTSTLPSSSNPPLLPKPFANVLVKRLSASELQDRRDKGLCSTYDEKFVLTH